MFGSLPLFIFIGILILSIISEHPINSKKGDSREDSSEDSSESSNNVEANRVKLLQGKITNLEDQIGRLLRALESTTTSTSIIQSTTTATSSPPQYHAMQYMGCYTDRTDPRAMMNFNLPAHTNTIDNCMNNCKSHGFKLSATEYGYECFCSNNLPNTATHPMRPDSKCNTNCRGNRHQKCGGHWAISIYATGL